MSRLRDLLALSDLQRWNVVPTSRVQSVAQHCFRVAVIAREIWGTWKQQQVESYNDISELLEILGWCLDHDGPECLTGDLPSAFKDSIPEEQLARIEHQLCPWYGATSLSVSELTLSVVGIAEAIESSAWLAVFGLTGTEPLVSDLRQKALSRCDRANLQWLRLGAAGRDVAEQVWREKFPLKLRVEKEKENHNAARSGTETGPAGPTRTTKDDNWQQP